MEKNNKRISTFLVAVRCMLSLAVLSSFAAWAQGTQTQPVVLTNAVVNHPIEFDVSPPLRDLPVEVLPPGAVHVVHSPLQPKIKNVQPLIGTAQPAAGGAPQLSLSPLITATVGLGFEGVGNTSILNCPTVAGSTVAPPDANLAVGDTQVVQWVNICYAVLDKATGHLIAGPFAGNQFWAGFGSSCATKNDGDIIIQWDKANHVWVASQNVFEAPYETCVAVSQTADATGRYNRYAFAQPGFPDYPKWGLTPNVFYQTQNIGNAGAYVGVNVCAYDGVAMRAGTTAKQICILDNSNGTLFDDSMLPADNDYAASPATTQPEILLGSIDNAIPGSKVYEYVFSVDFTAGTATLAGVNGTMPISVPPFLFACDFVSFCIPQPSPGSELLESIGDRLMYRLAHFDNGTSQYWLATHSVRDTLATDVRWYQFTAPEGSTSLSLVQSGDTPDDGKYRWLGSVAMDKRGNIALGYSRSSAAPGDYPSIYYAGQTAGDLPGTTESEALIHQGSGSQFATGSRWGDYSSIALDGADSCTFWYTNEYYPADGSYAWATWIASLKFANCLP